MMLSETGHQIEGGQDKEDCGKTKIDQGVIFYERGFCGLVDNPEHSTNHPDTKPKNCFLCQVTTRIIVRTYCHEVIISPIVLFRK